MAGDHRRRGLFAGELVYQTALPRPVYDLEHQGTDCEPRSADYQKRVIGSWRRATGHDRARLPWNPILAACAPVIWLPLPFLPSRTLYPLWASHFCLYCGNEVRAPCEGPDVRPVDRAVVHVQQTDMPQSHEKDLMGAGPDPGLGPVP